MTTRLVAAVLLCTIAVATASPADAEQPTTASGTFTLVDLADRIITLERTADGNQFL